MTQFPIQLVCEDCLEYMNHIPDQSIDLILTDPPYGTSASSWDKVIPMNKLWEHYKRIIKPNRAIVIFAQQPFTSLLVCSNLKMYKYNWVWQKDNGTNFLNSHHQPLKISEDICVFSTGSASPSKRGGGSMIYNPQFEQGKPYTCVSGKQKPDSAVVSKNRDGKVDSVDGFLTVNTGVRYPRNIIKFNRDKEKLHSTQKPIALLEYLIKTYSNEGDVVLDSCMGSGSTGVAALNTLRSFIGIENDEGIYNIAYERIKKIFKGGGVLN
jgi:site-specific DNA-methyltransferase (adenine-specific)